MLLLDNSAWARIAKGLLDQQRSETISSWIERRELAICLPFLLEAGYSAQSAVDHQTMMAELELLPRVLVTPEVEKYALHAQRELAAVGHHRLAPVDVMIAACAHEVEAGVLHYDHDYDILAVHTGLEFHSEWLAPPGTL